jgi:1-deoxy-D-xylulose-5-phosphate synthase
MIPVVAVYSSFLQRAVDQIIHDVCMQKLHVIFAIDRAGLVGTDGETHHGCFDLSYLTMIPNMTVMAPKNAWELTEMLRYAVANPGTYAIRYPKGAAYTALEDAKAPVVNGKSEVLSRGRRLAVLAVGSMVQTCEQVCRQLREDGYDPTFVNVRFVKPLDTALLDELAREHSLFVTVEENVKNGGFGEHVAAYMMACHPAAKVLPIAIWDRFIRHGSVDSLRSKIGLSPSEIVNAIEEYEE